MKANRSYCTVILGVLIFASASTSAREFILDSSDLDTVTAGVAGAPEVRAVTVYDSAGKEIAHAVAAGAVPSVSVHNDDGKVIAQAAAAGATPSLSVQVFGDKASPVSASISAFASSP